MSKNYQYVKNVKKHKTFCTIDLKILVIYTQNQNMYNKWATTYNFKTYNFSF